MTTRGRWSAALAARAAAAHDCPSRMPATVFRTPAHCSGAHAAPHSSISPRQRRSRRHLALVHLRQRPSSSWEAERNSANSRRSVAVSSAATLVSFLSFFALAISTASLVPATHCARVGESSRLHQGFGGQCHPETEGWAERRQAPGCNGTRLARLRGAPRPSKSEGRAPLGAPPWRFWAGGRASISGISSRSVQRAPRSQVIVPGGRDPGPPEPAVASRSRETPLLAPPSGSPLEDAPHERG